MPYPGYKMAVFYAYPAIARMPRDFTVARPIELIQPIPR
jgi:hypothetical protein